MPKEGRVSSCYSSLSSHVIEQLRKELQLMLPFSKSGSLGVSLISTIDSFLAGPESGFQGISTAAADGAESVLALRDMSRMLLAKRRSVFETFSIAETLLGKGSYFAPKARKMIESYVAYVESMEGQIQASFLRNATDAKALEIDMVHPNGHDGTKEGRIGLNNVLNPNGKVICTQMQESGSMKMTEPVLERIKVVLCSHFTTAPGQCHSWVTRKGLKLRRRRSFFMRSCVSRVLSRSRM